MIYEKLQKCRVELQNKKLKKSGKNNYAGFEYFELADFLPIINEMFLQNKMFSEFSMTNDCAILTIYDIEDNTCVKFMTPIAELELKGCNRIQALGGTHTYLKRYLYINALEIVESDLFDNITGKEEKEENKKEDIICPVCGKKTTSGALEHWGMCASCYKENKKENKNA